MKGYQLTNEYQKWRLTNINERPPFWEVLFLIGEYPGISLSEIKQKLENSKEGKCLLQTFTDEFSRYTVDEMISSSISKGFIKEMTK